MFNVPTKRETLKSTLLVFVVACFGDARIPVALRAHRDMPIVVSELSEMGARLVLVEENGRRYRFLSSSPSVVMDQEPVYGPKGRFVIFVSTREQTQKGKTDLWSLELQSKKVTRLQVGERVRDPSLGSDGWLYFSMMAEGETSFDLYRGRFVDSPVPRVEDVQRLSESDDDMRAPAQSMDGRIVCVRTSRESQESSLWQRLDGQSEWIEFGQETNAQTPMFLPGGELVFSAETARGDRDLFVYGSDGMRRKLLNEPLGDEIFPRVDVDGQRVFATSVLRANPGDVGGHLSLISFDIRAPLETLRVHFDPSDTQPRLGIALPPRKLDLKVLQNGPKYMDGLRRILLEKEVLREIEKDDKQGPRDDS